MDKHLEKSLSIINDNQIERSLSIVVGGYILSLGFYFIWCFYFFHERLNRDGYLLVIAVVVCAITAVHFFSLLLILYIRSLQKVWTSFFSVSIITLLIFFLIPYTNHLIYYKFHDKEKILTEKKRMEKVETKLKFEIAMNDASKKLITELQAKLESERKENEKLIKQLDETIRKMKSLEEERETKGDIFAQAKSDKNISKIKINSKMVNTESDTINQEIIFKVQIISSSTRLEKNSPKFNGLKNIWEYKDSDLYKYTVGNEKDLKSASAIQSELRKKEFNGAFVVAFKNGKRITIRDAKKFLTAY